MGETIKQNLKRPHWAVLRALELGDFEVSNLADHLVFLEHKGLVERQGQEWRLTEDGHTLVALRRHL
jgi:predicted transcriptional regulator